MSISAARGTARRARPAVRASSCSRRHPGSSRTRRRWPLGERDPGARQPRLDRAGSPATGRESGGRGYLAAGLFLVAALGFFVAQLDRQRRQRTQQVTPVAGGVPPLPRGTRRAVVREAAGPAAPRPRLAAPRPRGAPLRRGGALARLGARTVRPELPARPVRRVHAAALARAGPGGERADRSGGPGGRGRPAPTARRPPTPARPAGLDRPARFTSVEICGVPGPRPRPGPVADLLGGDVPLPRAPGGRGAGVGAEPRPLGLGQVAAARERAPDAGRSGWCHLVSAWPT